MYYYVPNRPQPLGQSVFDTYRRYIPQKPPTDVTTIALIGGSIALVGVVVFVKSRKKRKRKRKRK